LGKKKVGSLVNGNTGTLSSLREFHTHSLLLIVWRVVKKTLTNHYDADDDESDGEEPGRERKETGMTSSKDPCPQTIDPQDVKTGVLDNPHNTIMETHPSRV